MKRATPIFALLLFTACVPALAQDKVFDAHVHLWEYETSLQQYLDAAEAAGAQADRIGAIQGGNHMAQQGRLAEMRSNNDQLVALAAEHTTLRPTAERKSVVWGKGGSGRVDRGGRRI